jgi:Protein of unknown function (DUF3455)
MTYRLVVLSLLFAALTVSAQTKAPNVPDAIKAPAGKVVLIAHARGDQIYTCQSTPDGKYAWVLKAPEAQLFDDMGAMIGSHSAGPTWKLDDGSAVKGKAAAHVDQPDSIPWLLITVTDHMGAGKLSPVTTIQRINTKDGKAPATGCDAANVNKETRSNYTADYVFWAGK